MGGFQVKVPHGDATIWSNNIYLRTGGGDVDPGIITLDAAKGQKPITFNASTINNFVTESILDNFGSDGNIDVTPHLVGPVQRHRLGLLHSGLRLCSSDSVLVNGWLEIVGGHVGTELSMAYDGKVGWMAGPEPVPRLPGAGGLPDRARTTIRDEAKKFWQDLFTDYLYADKQAGNDDTIKAVHFTFRNPEQYHTQKFKLFEDRWQQLARLAARS